MLPQSISAIVHAAIDTGRSVELDIVRRAARSWPRAGEIEASGERPGEAATPDRDQLHAGDAARRASSRPRAFATMVDSGRACRPARSRSRILRGAGRPRRRSSSKRQVKALRRLGFGFAVDDAGAGYAELRADRRAPPVDRQDRPVDRRAASPATTRSRRSSRRSCRSGGGSGRGCSPRGSSGEPTSSMLSALGVELGQAT